MDENLPDVWYKELFIEYADGTKEYLHIERKPTGTHIPLLRGKPEPWTALAFHKCPGCPLPELMPNCPAAISLQTTLGKLRSRHSIDRVKATAVDARGRSQTVEWALQDVGATLVQLAVFASECPVGRRLKPYLAGLAPFVSSLELSRHIGTQILRKYGGSLDAARQELTEALAPLHEVFVHLAQRLNADAAANPAPVTRRDQLSPDAVPNSISSMDALTLLLAMRADRLLGQLSKELGWSQDAPPPADPAAHAKPAGLVDRLRALFR